jgi:hypothetical protein
MVFYPQIFADYADFCNGQEKVEQKPYTAEHTESAHLSRRPFGRVSKGFLRVLDELSRKDTGQVCGENQCSTFLCPL